MADNNTNTSPRMSIPHHSPPNLFPQQRKVFILRHWTHILQTKYTATLPIDGMEWLQKLRSDTSVLRMFHRGFEHVNHRVPFPAAGGEDENPLLMARAFGEQIDEALSWFKLCRAEWGLTEEVEKMWMEVVREREAAKRELEERKMWKQGLRDRVEGHKRKRERVGEWIQGVQSPGAEESRPSMQEADMRQVIKKEGGEGTLDGRNDGTAEAHQPSTGDDAARVVKIETPAPTRAKLQLSRMPQTASPHPTPTLTIAKKPAAELAAKSSTTHTYPMPVNPTNGANNQMRFEVRDTRPTMAPIPARPDAGSRSRYPMPSDYAAQTPGQRLHAQGPQIYPGPPAPLPVYLMMNCPQRGGLIPPGMPNNVSVLSLQPPLRPQQGSRARSEVRSGAPSGNGTSTPWMRYPAPLQQRSFPHDILRTQSLASRQLQPPFRTNAVRNFIPNQVSHGGIDPRMIPQHPNGPGTAQTLPIGAGLDHATGPYLSAAPPTTVNPSEIALRDPDPTGQWNDLSSTNFQRGGTQGGAAAGR